MPVLYNLKYTGYLGLYKGCFSLATYNGIKIVFESIIGELTWFER